MWRRASSRQATFTCMPRPSTQRSPSPLHDQFRSPPPRPPPSTAAADGHALQPVFTTLRSLQQGQPDPVVHPQARSDNLGGHLVVYGSRDVHVLQFVPRLSPWCSRYVSQVAHLWGDRRAPEGGRKRKVVNCHQMQTINQKDFMATRQSSIDCAHEIVPSAEVRPVEIAPFFFCSV